MKTKILLSILAVGFFVNAFSQKPTMELTFTAENNGQYVPLDSIFIKNLTQGGDTTLYAPDTTLLLEYIVGIADNDRIEKNSFFVSQNYPNPFERKTAFLFRRIIPILLNIIHLSIYTYPKRNI
jgi:hypothetical protein